MVERIKSVILMLLVLLSFYLTYHLWWDQPTFEPLVIAEYTEPNKIGEQKNWNELIRPQEIYFHYEGNKHTKAISEMSLYRMLWDSLQTWQFVQGAEVNINYARGKEILEEHHGLEYVFADELPLQYFANVLQLPDTFPVGISSLNRIWVYEETDRSEYKVLFISDSRRRAFEATLREPEREHGLSVRNLIILGSQLNEQLPAQYFNVPATASGVHVDFFNLIYLPVERIEMNQWTYQFTAIDIEEMSTALFLDTSALKEIPERGGSRIFTDGTKSLQYKEKANEIRFYLPTYEQGLNAVIDKGYYPVLDFMNHHYGWTGDYRIDRFVRDQAMQGVAFREYINGFPLYSESGTNFGQIELKYQYNQVNEYARNLLRLESSNTGYQIKIKSGAELIEELRSKGIYLYNINQIELGYKAVFRMDRLETELVPHFIIHFYTDREPLMIDARVQNVEG